MSTLLFANNAFSTLAGPIANTAIAVNLASGSGVLFPSPSAGQYFCLTLIDAATGLLNEITHCTSRSGDTLTIVRAQEGTTALNWAAGDLAQNLVTAGTMATLAQQPVALTANFSVYVSATGSDITGDGSAGNPWATIQNALNIGQQSYNLGPFNYIINVGTGGTFAVATLAAPFLSAGGQVIILGNGIANTTIKSTLSGTVYCLSAGPGASFHVDSCTFTSTGSGGGALFTNAGLIAHANCAFSTCGGVHIETAFGGLIEATGPVTIEGNAVAHLVAGTGGVIYENVAVTPERRTGVLLLVRKCLRLRRSFGFRVIGRELHRLGNRSALFRHGERRDQYRRRRGHIPAPGNSWRLDHDGRSVYLGEHDALSGFELVLVDHRQPHAGLVERALGLCGAFGCNLCRLARSRRRSRADCNTAADLAGVMLVQWVPTQLALGLAIVSTGTPALSGTLIDQPAQQNIGNTGAYIMTNSAFPGGTSTMPWGDLSRARRTHFHRLQNSRPSRPQSRTMWPNSPSACKLLCSAAAPRCRRSPSRSRKETEMPTIRRKVPTGPISRPRRARSSGSEVGYSSAST